MFGIGFWKILLLAAVVTAVWYGFRWLERARRQAALEERRLAERRLREPPVELKRNPATGTYEAPRREDRR